MAVQVAPMALLFRAVSVAVVGYEAFWAHEQRALGHQGQEGYNTILLHAFFFLLFVFKTETVIDFAEGRLAEIVSYIWRSCVIRALSVTMATKLA